MEDALNYRYKQVATEIKHLVEDIWVSEESMTNYFLEFFPHSEFHRTTSARMLVAKLLDEGWKRVPNPLNIRMTSHDYKQIIKELADILDFNLWTQIYQNSIYNQPCSYNLDNMRARLQQVGDELNTIYKVSAPNAKTKFMDENEVLTDQVEWSFRRSHNEYIGLLRALDILEKKGLGVPSYRITPKGQTPAFADSCNISMINPWNAEAFLGNASDVIKVYTFGIQSPIENLVVPTEEGKYKCAFCDYDFVSKSGGDILERALTSRYIAHKVYKNHADLIDGMVLRLNSVVVFTRNTDSNATDKIYLTDVFSPVGAPAI